MMNKDIFVKLLQERRYKSVKDVLDVMNAVDIASLLGEFDDKELALAFRLIPKEKAADVFANMESSLQSVLVEVLSEKELKEVRDKGFAFLACDLMDRIMPIRKRFTGSKTIRIRGKKVTFTFLCRVIASGCL